MSANGISESLSVIFSASGALDSFRRLPAPEQARFARWIEMAHDEESRLRRIEALVLALRLGPLGSPDETGPGKKVAHRGRGGFAG
jgi:Bacteriocin-protection, YdeI or OmpD-Associated